MKNGSILRSSTSQTCKWLMAVCLVASMLMTALSVGASAASIDTESYIGEARAKTIALETSGVSEANATFLKVHLDYDDRRVVYDVEFYSGNTEYDYEIDAESGRVLEYDKDIEYYSIPSSSSSSTNAGQYIGETKARSIALTQAGISEDQATFIKSHLDYDDGRVVYDIEFYSGDTEYDYEIAAVSGEIVESDMEIEYYSIPRNQSGTSASRPADTGNYIGDAQAKSIALKHAGVTESQTTAIRVHLDYDDGRVDYDVEFYAGNTEYEYEIDAVSGSILEFDRETKDRTIHGKTGTSGSSSQQTRPAASTGNYIGEAKAKSIALSNAGLAESQVRRMKVKLDREHGTMVYEVEFKNGLMEYEYEIDATSGAILESDVEYDD